MGSEGRIPRIFNSALDGSEWLDSHTGCFTSGETARDMNWIGNRMDPERRSERYGEKGNSYPYRISNPDMIPYVCVPCIRVLSMLL
jgi:hypothetical protein